MSTKPEPSAVATNAVRIVRDFDTNCATVWRAWTDPKIVSQWFGSDPAGSVLKATLDVQPGGIYSITFRDSSGQEHTASGQYRAVRHPRELSFTWTWKSEPDHQTLVTVLLEDREGGTRMTFEHSQLWAGSSHGYAEGWRSTFDKMARALAGLEMPHLEP
ncbi:activator of HSP90 ATPase [Steroidobacter agaridevorans]|uniref:Activator of HSP90 ATPase n=1 Tax=Steroidobacter agaridevorans TaxID=2695856 RepID=A0A829Y4G9_9GAMM|nr:SRPBCC domain-containing protein [Steroidobacter agaridevorans]GFE78084.1 activator of HSP90 ATPase [Steroidobacter agaridevorans]